MKDSMIYYTVGALLYCPANNKTVANSIISEKFGNKYSLALCLEDTINDDNVQDAEQQLISTLSEIYNAHHSLNFYLPKIFIRVRNAPQMEKLTSLLGDSFEIVTGFIFPKFSIQNADRYIDKLVQINHQTHRVVYGMPIYESSSIIALNTRYDVLYALKHKIDEVSHLILNVRVGGNDLCHHFGFRRHIDESIHKMKPIADLFSDIITIYGHDYVVSGPVWEYYNGTHWENGLRDEISDDILCGFIGKTAIHPNQIEVINSSYKVCKEDYMDAQNILNWNSTPSLVAGSALNNRMNEYKTHTNWARKILYLAKYYGTY